MKDTELIGEGTVRVVRQQSDEEMEMEETVFSAVRQAGYSDGVKSGFMYGCFFAAAVVVLAEWIWG